METKEILPAPVQTYSRKMCRTAWRKLTCKQRNQIKWACDQMDDDNLHAGFRAYKQMLFS